ncbi:universal stress protein [Streptomyces halobius]|uniref:Universal stress protein n=1 Tax=Streptomyces halobius TaxID=2879846 RepID=A0ABY4MJ56_9ACTN|nr:universal stress protein [Streptomyces halobius]UQA97387.1 universal stress protein [Streptomyces halobius]
MELPLVVGVDGSDSGFRALDWAVDEAALHGLPLRLVHASEWERYEGPVSTTSLSSRSGRALADTIVGTSAERARHRNPGVKVSAQVLAEDTVAALLRQGRFASAVILGARGRSAFAGMLLGSVGLAVAARAPCPVIVVRGDEALAGRHGRILLGVGDTATGSAAVQFAFREAEARGCALDAVRAWRCPAHESGDHATDRPPHTQAPERYHEERASALLDEALAEAVEAHPTVQVRRVTVEGPAHKVLVPRSSAADLLVVGARRRQDKPGLQLGRLSHTVLHHADCPVAVVPQAA